MSKELNFDSINQHLENIKEGLYDYWCMECDKTGIVDEIVDVRIRPTPLNEEDGYSPKCPNCGDGMLSSVTKEDDPHQAFERLKLKTFELYKCKLYLMANN